MTTREAIYKTALEHIRDGSDAVCTECGWMGHEEETSGFDSDYCPECFSKEIRTGPDEIAAYALAQGEKGSDAHLHHLRQDCRYSTIRSWWS